MTNCRSKPVTTRILLTSGALVVAVVLFSYHHRADRPVLFYYGASPGEVPQGTAIAILNPFRSRKDESNADWLIRDLRTDKCSQIVIERLRTNPERVCAAFRDNKRASLIWLDPEQWSESRGNARSLIYDLPESRSRLIVYFATDDMGWGVSTVSIIR